MEKCPMNNFAPNSKLLPNFRHSKRYYIIRSGRSADLIHHETFLCAVFDVVSLRWKAIKKEKEIFFIIKFV